MKKANQKPITGASMTAWHLAPWCVLKQIPSYYTLLPIICKETDGYKTDSPFSSRGGSLFPKYTIGAPQGRLATECHSWELSLYGLEMTWGNTAGVCFFEKESCKGYAAGLVRTMHSPSVCMNVTGFMEIVDGHKIAWKSYKFVTLAMDCPRWYNALVLPQ